MSSDLLGELHCFLDEHRGRESSATLVDRWLHEQCEALEGQSLTPELLYARFLTPQPLAAFIARLAALYSASSVLDPTCGSGLLLHAVATSVQAEAVHGIDINPRSAQLAQAVLGDRATCSESTSRHP